jgi:hypothetical protein
MTIADIDNAITQILKAEEETKTYIIKDRKAAYDLKNPGSRKNTLSKKLKVLFECGKLKLIK